MDDVYSPTIKDKLSTADLEKQDMINRIVLYKQFERLSYAPDKDYIVSIVAKDRGIKIKVLKSNDASSRLILKFVVYPNKVDVISEVDTQNGAEGS